MLTNTSGFVYYVSITGITGSATPNTSRVSDAVARIKRHTRLPVAVGFGVRTAQNAREIAQGADAVVVGSALIDRLRDSLDAEGRATAGSGQGGDVRSCRNLPMACARSAASRRNSHQEAAFTGEGLSMLTRRTLMRGAAAGLAASQLPACD